MVKRPKKVNQLFKFLEKHHEFNQRIQRGHIQQTLASCDAVPDKARLLLFKAVNTQSQPNLDSIAKFFISLEATKNSLSSFANFLRFLKVPGATEDQLFKALKKQDGWGPKTAALFVKNLFLIQSTSALKSQLWRDLDKVKATEIFLPVDAVIEHIFLKLNLKDDDSKNTARNFNSINRCLKKDFGYANSEILIWDDLWFWGFITQNSQMKSAPRKLGWNESKYWSIFTAPKDEASIRNIRSLAKRFLKILEA